MRAALLVLAVVAAGTGTNWTQSREDARAMFTFACLPGPRNGLDARH